MQSPLISLGTGETITSNATTKKHARTRTKITNTSVSVGLWV